MKKIFALLVVVVMASCGSSESSEVSVDSSYVDSSLASDTVLVSDTLVVGGGVPSNLPIK
jgi:hypothetical protein